MKRNYKHEYTSYYGDLSKGLTRKQTLHRKHKSRRNMNRQKYLRKGLVKKYDRYDIDHIDGNPMNNKPSNLRVLHRKYNRSNKKF